MEQEYDKLESNENLKYRELGERIGEELAQAKARSQVNLGMVCLFIVGFYLLFDKNPNNDFLAFLVLIFGLLLLGRGK